jgi:hypothetical protein
MTEVPTRDHAGHAAKAREYLKGTSPGAFSSLKPDVRIALANVHATLALYELLRVADEHEPLATRGLGAQTGLPTLGSSERALLHGRSDRPENIPPHFRGHR